MADRDPLDALLASVDSALAGVLFPFARDLARRVRRAGSGGTVGPAGRQALATWLAGAIAALFGGSPQQAEGMYGTPGTIPHLVAASTRAAARVAVAPVVTDVARRLAGQPQLVAALSATPPGNPRPPIFDPVRTWVDPNGHRLSDRVWQSGREVRARIDAVLDFGIASGASAEDLGLALEEFLTFEGRYSKQKILVQQPDGTTKLEPKPITTRTPYGRVGLAYPRRLARTETPRAYGAATVEAARRNPFVAGVKWNLSASHPEQDECDVNATRDAHGLGRGVYPAGRVPTYPNHPHDLCYLTSVERQDTDRVVADLARWVRGDLPADWGGLDTGALVRGLTGFEQAAG